MWRRCVRPDRWSPVSALRMCVSPNTNPAASDVEFSKPNAGDPHQGAVASHKENEAQRQAVMDEQRRLKFISTQRRHVEAMFRRNFEPYCCTEDAAHRKKGGDGGVTHRASCEVVDGGWFLPFPVVTVIPVETSLSAGTRAQLPLKSGGASVRNSSPGLSSSPTSTVGGEHATDWTAKIEWAVTPTLTLSITSTIGCTEVVARTPADARFRVLSAALLLLPNPRAVARLLEVLRCQEQGALDAVHQAAGARWQIELSSEPVQVSSPDAPALISTLKGDDAGRAPRRARSRMHTSENDGVLPSEVDSTSSLLTGNIGYRVTIVSSLPDALSEWPLDVRSTADPSKLEHARVDGRRNDDNNADAAHRSGGQIPAVLATKLSSDESLAPARTTTLGGGGGRPSSVPSLFSTVRRAFRESVLTLSEVAPPLLVDLATSYQRELSAASLVALSPWQDDHAGMEGDVCALLGARPFSIPSSNFLSVYLSSTIQVCNPAPSHHRPFYLSFQELPDVQPATTERDEPGGDDDDTVVVIRRVSSVQERRPAIAQLRCGTTPTRHHRRRSLRVESPIVSVDSFVSSALPPPPPSALNAANRTGGSGAPPAAAASGRSHFHDLTALLPSVCDYSLATAGTTGNHHVLRWNMVGNARLAAQCRGRGEGFWAAVYNATMPAQPTEAHSLDSTLSSAAPPSIVRGQQSCRSPSFSVDAELVCRHLMGCSLQSFAKTQQGGAPGSDVRRVSWWWPPAATLIAPSVALAYLHETLSVCGAAAVCSSPRALSVQAVGFLWTASCCRSSASQRDRVLFLANGSAWTAPPEPGDIKSGSAAGGVDDVLPATDVRTVLRELITDCVLPGAHRSATNATNHVVVGADSLLTSRLTTVECDQPLDDWACGAQQDALVDCPQPQRSTDTTPRWCYRRLPAQELYKLLTATNDSPIRSTPPLAAQGPSVDPAVPLGKESPETNMLDEGGDALQRDQTVEVADVVLMSQAIRELLGQDPQVVPRLTIQQDVDYCVVPHLLCVARGEGPVEIPFRTKCTLEWPVELGRKPAVMRPADRGGTQNRRPTGGKTTLWLSISRAAALVQLDGPPGLPVNGESALPCVIDCFSGLYRLLTCLSGIHGRGPTQSSPIYGGREGRRTVDHLAVMAAAFLQEFNNSPSPMTLATDSRVGGTRQPPSSSSDHLLLLRAMDPVTSTIPVPTVIAKDASRKQGFLDFVLFHWFHAPPIEKYFLIKKHDLPPESEQVVAAQDGRASLCPSSTGDGHDDDVVAARADVVESRAHLQMIRGQLFYDILGSRLLLAAVRASNPEQARRHLLNTAVVRNAPHDDYVRQHRRAPRAGASLSPSGYAHLTEPTQRYAVDITNGRIPSPLVCLLGLLAEVGHEGRLLVVVNSTRSVATTEESTSATTSLLLLLVVYAGGDAQLAKISETVRSASFVKDNLTPESSTVFVCSALSSCCLAYSVIPLPGTCEHQPAYSWLHMFEVACRQALIALHKQPLETARALSEALNAAPCLPRDAFPMFYDAAFYTPTNLLAEALQGIAARYDAQYEPCMLLSGHSAMRAPGGGGDAVGSAPGTLEPTVGFRCTVSISSVAGLPVPLPPVSQQGSPIGSRGAPLGVGEGRDKASAWRAAAAAALRTHFPQLLRQVSSLRELHGNVLPVIAPSVIADAGLGDGVRYAFHSDGASHRVCTVQNARSSVAIVRASGSTDGHAFVEAVELLCRRLRADQSLLVSTATVPPLSSSAVPLEFRDWDVTSNYQKSAVHALLGALGTVYSGKLRLFINHTENGTRAALVLTVEILDEKNHLRVGVVQPPPASDASSEGVTGITSLLASGAPGVQEGDGAAFVVELFRQLRTHVASKCSPLVRRETALLLQLARTRARLSCLSGDHQKAPFRLSTERCVAHILRNLLGLLVEVAVEPTVAHQSVATAYVHVPVVGKGELQAMSVGWRSGHPCSSPADRGLPRKPVQRARQQMHRMKLISAIGPSPRRANEALLEAVQEFTDRCGAWE